MARRGRSASDEETSVLTIAEAAYAAELPRKTVEQTVDRGEVKALKTRGRARRLGWQAAVYLRVRNSAGDLLTTKARRRLYDALSGQGAEIEQVDIGPLTVRTTEAAARVRARMREIQSARRAVVIDPGIRGGEPVVRGTRIPVQMLVDLVRAGVSRERILEDYPALTARRLEDTLRWAKLYPRVGRPMRTPPGSRESQSTHSSRRNSEQAD